MQKIRFYLLDNSIIDGYVEDTGIANLRLIDLLNSHINKKKMGTSVFLSIKDGVQMIFTRKNADEELNDSLVFAEEEEEKEVPMDFILNERLQLEKTLDLSDRLYSVNLSQVLFGHSMSEFKGIKQERQRALKNLIPKEVNIVTFNNYHLNGNIMIPAINKGQFPKDLNVGKNFIVLSNVKLKYLPSKKNYYRFHDHLIVNTQLIKAFY